MVGKCLWSSLAAQAVAEAPVLSETNIANRVRRVECSNLKGCALAVKRATKPQAAHRYRRAPGSSQAAATAWARPAVQPCRPAPATMPSSAHSSYRLPVPSPAIAGPGQTPHRPQPMPKIAEPITVSRSSGVWRRSNSPPSSGAFKRRGSPW